METPDNYGEARKAHASMVRLDASAMLIVNNLTTLAGAMLLRELAAAGVSSEQQEALRPMVQQIIADMIASSIVAEREAKGGGLNTARPAGGA